MNPNSEAGGGSLLPARRDLNRGLLLAVLLSLVFLALTAYQSAATLIQRVAQTDVMKAATSSAWSGRVALEISWFVAAILLTHMAMGVVAWGLACASAINSATVRAKFGRYTVGWFALLAAATIAYSALWHPRTLLGAYYHDLLSSTIGSMPLGRVFYLGVLAVAALVVLRAAWCLFRTPRLAGQWRLAAAGLPIAVLVAVALSLTAEEPVVAAHSSDPRPHVIILGIDSLRLDQVGRYGGQGLTPNLDAFIADADLFSDATTPLGRTFPSWVSILTGRSPPHTGARFNLAERSRVKTDPTVADVLRKAGYRTVYSTDEVRFANIDQSYGFDQVVTPRIGASDFIVGTYNELPLSSLLINSRVGEWLFPFSYANRGVATMFQPETFVERLDREVSFDRPTLFISHLTASHWPYFTADTPFGIPSSDGGERRPLYEEGLRTADRMFGELVSMLGRKGALDNAIVVVLSDHGEALGLANDSFFHDGAIVEGLRAPLKMMDMGHGQSVLSPSQYHVLLGFRAFGPRATFVAAGRDFNVPVSVEDISPTLLDLHGITGDPLDADGVSLANDLRTGVAATPADGADVRIRFTETDLKVLPSQDGTVDEDATARENSRFFEVNPRTARLNIRESFAPLAIAFKERAAFTNRHLLAAIPAGPDAHEYLYFDLETGRGRLLLARPDSGDPDAQRLWDALGQHYGAELKTPVSVTRDDWPVIEAAWAGFFGAREPWRGNGPEYPMPPGATGG